MRRTFRASRFASMRGWFLPLALASLALLLQAPLAFAQGPPGLAARVLALEQAVSAHSRQLNTLQGQMSVLSARVSDLRQQVLVQRAQIVALRQQFTSVAQLVSGLGADVAGLAQRVAAAEGQITSLQQGADAFAAQLASLAARVSAIEDRVLAIESAGRGPRRLTSVDCGAGQSVNAILANLPAGANTVEVSGICPEDVRIDGFEDLWLVGLPGAGLRSLTIEQSRRVQARAFALSPTGASGVTVRKSSCDLAAIAVDGASMASGFLIDRDSDVSLAAGSATNVRNGLTVSGRSMVTVQGTLSLAGLFSTTPSDSSSGILLVGASLIQASLDGPSSLRGFSTGLSSSDNSTVSVFVSGGLATPLLVIDSNRNGGIAASGGRVALIGPSAVNGHVAGSAVSLFDGGSLELSQGVRIQGNGTGISLRNNATARIVFGTEIAGNNFGISARNSSVVDFAGLSIVFGTNGTDVSCDATSVASRVGLTNAATVNCVNQN